VEERCRTVTDEHRPVNPFAPVGYPRVALLPLCPLKSDRDRHRYVSIDGLDAEWEKFVVEIDDLTAVRADGRLVLVTGESGCGKTSLIHKCVDLVCRQQNSTPDVKELVFDLTSCLPKGNQQTMRERAEAVSEALVTDLLDRPLVRKNLATELREDRSEPQRIYRRLARALQRKDVVLVVLLPEAGNRLKEVISYANEFAGPGILFMIESADLDRKDVADIVEQLEGAMPPITLHLEQLKPGDAENYIAARLDHTKTPGIFPQMGEELISEVGKTCKTVAQLQKRLYHTYRVRFDRKLSYTNDDRLTLDDLNAFYSES
jgi:energy-coupling factor transporter ATP-binding protein EcfA2